MQTENKLFEDLSKVATAALGTIAGMTREVEDTARRRAREFVGGAEAVDREEFEAVRAVAMAAREEVEQLKAELAKLRAQIATPAAKKPTKS